jgi:hypothetical protein
MIPCVKHESIFAIGFMHRSWILWRCRLHSSRVTHTSVAISRSPLTLFSLTISGRLWCGFHWRFHASTMNLFSLIISLVNRELVFAVDSTRQPWLNFQRWFLVLQWLSFRWRFMHKHWHWVFDDSMRQTWICFCYRFYASLVNSFDTGDSIRQLSLIFQWRFQGVLWLYFCWRFLVGRDAVFTNDSMRQRW